MTLWLKTRLVGIHTNFIFGSSLIHNDVSHAVYAASGSFVAAPEPAVAGVGLAAVQTALDVQRRGVSAKKVVVTLP